MRSLSFILLLFVFITNSFAQAVPIRLTCCSRPVSENNPLWIIVFKKKGYVINYSSASLINPNTIEKVEVLKNAAATAIYGFRAAYGVVVLKIKKTEARKEYKRLKPYLE